MKKWIFFAILLTASLASGGAVAVSSLSLRKRLESLLPIFRRVADQHSVPISWPLALARQESGFVATAKNEIGPDGALGGAYGLTQITWQLAQSLGFQGTKAALLDPEIHLHLAVGYLAELKDKGLSFADVASTWNSGRTLSKLNQAINDFDRQGKTSRADRLRRTRDVYVPQVVKFQREYAVLDSGKELVS